MRTTIDIPDHLLVEAKQLAAKQHRPLTVLVSESLRAYLAEQRMQKPARHVSFPTNKRAKPRAGLDLTDTSALWGADDSL